MIETRRGVRRISYSEISTAMTCQARWDFSYGGQLAGSTLKSRRVASILSDGKAWGAGVAAWHAYPQDDSLLSVWREGRARISAHQAMRDSFAQDIQTQLKDGVYVPMLERVEALERLGSILDHHMSTTVPFDNLTMLEQELDVPVPSRTGKKVSNRYHFHGFIDGFTVDHNDEWIVEFKLRTSLTDPKQMQLSQQIKDYAWARQQITGRRVVGVIVEERLAEAPKPPRLVNAKRKGEGINGLVPSHAVQLTLPEDYKALCVEYGVEPDMDLLQSLKSRQWYQRFPVRFRPDELEEAGRCLVSSAKLIRDLDSGELYPVRNTEPMLCRSCRYKVICANPMDENYVDTLFTRGIPKRLRPTERIERGGTVAADPETGEVASAAPFNPFALVK